MARGVAEPRAPRVADGGFTLCVALLALAARALACVLLPPRPAWDGVIYERAARGLARGLGYATFMFPQRSSDTVATGYYPVGYPAFLGALYRLFGQDVRVAYAAGAILGGLSAALVHRVALPAGVARARAAALLAALFPGSVLFAGAPMTETLSGCLMIAAVWALARGEASARASALVATGVLLGAATYVRPQALLLAPLLPWFRPSALAPGLRGRALAALLVSAVALACVLPWTARNCARLDGCALVSTNGGSNLAIGALPRATGEFFFLNADDGCRGVRGDAARDRCWRRVAWTSVRRAPWRWLARGGPKLAATLGHESFPLDYLREAGTLRLGEPARSRWLARLSLAWYALALAALAGALPLLRAPLPAGARAALAAVACTLVTHAVFFGGDRYHLPLVPLLAVLAAYALRELPRARRNSSTGVHRTPRGSPKSS